MSNELTKEEKKEISMKFFLDFCNPFSTNFPGVITDNERKEQWKKNNNSK